MRVSKKTIYQYMVPLFTAFLFCLLLLISIFGTWYLARNHVARVIHNDIQKLSEIFDDIHSTCTIVDFEYQQNPINFLNIRSFVGSEIGPMTVQYPEQWRGPYVQDNFTVQEKAYMIVKTRAGYFITPGNGVRLPNKKYIGIDIILDERANIPAMMNDPQQLKHEQYIFAVQILDKKTPVTVSVSED